MALGLVARWAGATRDGDIAGGDFPGWLVDLIGRNRSLGLADRRGECIYSACDHYRKCFIERSVRRARRASIVIANHALTMIQAARAGEGDNDLPSRYIFDEGHHLFDAADSAFAGHLTGLETADLRRWLIGADSGRLRGLKRRVEDLVAGDQAASEALQAILEAARILPSEGWQRRVNEGTPSGPLERFLIEVRALVRARAKSTDSPHGLEADCTAPHPALLERGEALGKALEALLRPMRALAQRLGARLVDEAETLDTPTRQRIEAVVRGLKRRADLEIAAWRDMLAGLGKPTPPEFTDWFGVERIDGRDIDIGFYRHWVDPTVPFISAVALPAQGVLVTSATLTDGRGEEASRLGRGGSAHRRASSALLAAGSRRLALRLSEADAHPGGDRYRQARPRPGRRRLSRAVPGLGRRRRLASSPPSSGCAPCIGASPPISIPPACRCWPSISTGYRPTHWSISSGPRRMPACWVPMRCATASTCQAVPCASSSSIACPGPAPPSCIARARPPSAARDYDDGLTRLRLKQAFGRLIRRATDRGVFVLLDRALPSRLAGAFPDGVALRRTGLADAVALTRDFLAHERPAHTPQE